MNGTEEGRPMSSSGRAQAVDDDDEDRIELFTLNLGY